MFVVETHSISSNDSFSLLGVSATAVPHPQDDYIHIATHGISGGEIPTLAEPAGVLSYEHDEDGLPTAGEVARFELDAEIAAVSACNTGNGEYFRGEGLMGMGRAFMEAGARNVIVSLWPVNSFATKELMVSFYRYLSDGDAPDAVLAEARQHFLDEGSASGELA